MGVTEDSALSQGRRPQSRAGMSSDSDRPPSVMSGGDGDVDEVDQKLHEYFNGHPDFVLDVEKLKKGWYFFGKPIGKKVYIKLTGRDTAVLKVGGGFKALSKFLDEYRLGSTVHRGSGTRHASV